MPLVRIDLPAGKPASYREAVVETVQSAKHSALNVPMAEHFQIVAEHAPADLSIDRTYLGIQRSPDAVVVQITLNEGRNAGIKTGFYKALADGLHERVGLQRADVLINLVEVKRENWSFGNGEAQLVLTGPPLVVESRPSPQPVSGDHK
jgi:4-oxalocrotonate tautomerase